MFKTLTEDANFSTKGSVFSAGVDVYASEDVIIGAGETKLVPLGIAIDELKIKEMIYSELLPFRDYKAEQNKNLKIFNKFLKSNYISLEPRSSLMLKGLISHSAIIYLDCKDEIKMIIHNPISGFDDEFLPVGALQFSEFEIKKGDRIGKLLLMEHKSYLFGIESEYERTGGFGSTGA